MSIHNYEIDFEWTGNLGAGTSGYKVYSRNYLFSSSGKTPVEGSADKLYRGDEDKYNPEELFLVSICSCHMLWYLHLCADEGVNVLEYKDRPHASLKLQSDGGGRFETVVLKPIIKIEDAEKKELARSLHAQAHHKCFIANSLNVSIQIEAIIGSKSSN